MADTCSVHVTVLKEEVVTALAPKKHKTYIDGTFGGGGITEALLATGAHVIAIDQDETAFVRREDLQKKYPKTLQYVHDNFENITAIMARLGKDKVDGIALDLGLSSDQLDTPQRGFAYRHNGPLDMRMNPTEQAITAADILNNTPESRLADIFYNYGDEKKSRVLARNICSTRKHKPFRETAQLLKEVEKIYPVKIGQRRSHPALRIFQALRIAVNDELSALEKVLPQATHLLADGASLAVVTFHSLEDRCIKTFFKKQCEDTLDIFGRTEKEAPFFMPIRKIKPSLTELEANNRARSGTLRVLTKKQESTL